MTTSGNNHERSNYRWLAPAGAAILTSSFIIGINMQMSSNQENEVRKLQVDAVCATETLSRGGNVNDALAAAAIKLSADPTLFTDDIRSGATDILESVGSVDPASIGTNYDGDVITRMPLDVSFCLNPELTDFVRVEVAPATVAASTLGK